MIESPALLAAAAAVGIASGVGTGLVRSVALRRGMLDKPNARSMHAQPTPRGGGLAIVLAFLGYVGVALAMNWIDPTMGQTLLVGGAATAILGLLDDRRPLPDTIRLSTWGAIAIGSVLWMGGLPSLDLGHGRLPLGFAGSVLAAIGIVWMINLYNFMDGIDGIAASQAIVVSLAAGALLMRGDPGTAGLMLALAAASAGFLRWNWPPARIFMGDVGSGFLGFVFAIVALGTERSGALPLLAWVILMGVFLVDATFTLARRLAARDRVNKPHRSHAYQRVALRLGRHLPVTLGVIALDLGLAAIAWGALQWRPALLPVAVASTLLLGAGWAWLRAWSR